jgi:hypothetical protein
MTHVDSIVGIKNGTQHTVYLIKDMFILEEQGNTCSIEIDNILVELEEDYSAMIDSYNADVLANRYW